MRRRGVKNQFGRELGGRRSSRASGECFTYCTLKFTCWPLTQSGGRNWVTAGALAVEYRSKKGMQKLRAHGPFVCRCLEAPEFCLNRFLLTGSFETPTASTGRRNGNFASYCAFFCRAKYHSLQFTTYISCVCVHPLCLRGDHMVPDLRSVFVLFTLWLLLPPPPPRCRQPRSAPESQISLARSGC